MKIITIFFFLAIPIVTFSQSKTEVPADGALGISKQIENNQVFINGGMLIYTKAYAIMEGEKYVKFLNPRRKDLKDIWLPDNGPVVMKKDW